MPQVRFSGQAQGAAGQTVIARHRTSTTKIGEKNVYAGRLGEKNGLLKTVTQVKRFR